MLRPLNRPNTGTASMSTLCALPAWTRRRYVENEVMHGYCGRSHAAAAGRLRFGRAAVAAHNMSGTCALSGCERPRFPDVATGGSFDFCSRSHYREAVRRSERPPDSSGGGTGPVPDARRRCALPGCETDVAVSETGRLHDYCGRRVCTYMYPAIAGYH